VAAAVIQAQCLGTVLASEARLAHAEALKLYDALDAINTNQTKLFEERFIVDCVAVFK
jgi:hypothetical protein